MPHELTQDQTAVIRGRPRAVGVDEAMTPVLETYASPKESDMSADGPVGRFSSYEAIYIVEKPRLVRTLMNSGVGFHDADDVAQQAMIALYKQWGIVEYPTSWLRKVAFRIARKTQQLNECSLDSQHQVECSAEAAAFEYLLEEYEVLAVIKKLPAIQRQVFALSYDQLSTKEIAEVLQIAEAAVRQNLSRARRRLRELRNLASAQDGPKPGWEGASK